MLKLYIGNKNYSSWSLRPWLTLTDAGIPFEEVKVRFDSFDAGSEFKRTVGALAPTGKVPVLVLEDGTAVWDTLAIAETLAELHPQHGLWPTDARARAHARSLCAEMHSGFGALRTHCPMNVEARLPDTGAAVLAGQPAVRADLDRITGMWCDGLARYGGPWLFGERFTIADAYYAPVALRLITYALPVPAEVAAYLERLVARPSMAAWITAALAEQDFLVFEEPYRQAPEAPQA